MAEQNTEQIPEGWKETTLGEISDIQTGPFGSQLHQEDYVVVGTPIITVEHLVDNRIVHSSDIPKVSAKDSLRLSKYLLKYGDIVYSRVGSVDRCAFVTENEDGWLFSGRLLRVRSRTALCNQYIFYWLSQNTIKEFVRRIAVGATMPSLNTNLLSLIPVLIPPLPEQRAIASVLSSFDDKIELLREQNKTLEAIAQTLFKRWFVEFNFADENGRPYRDSGGKMIDSELGEIPEGWKVGRLENELEVIMGQSPKGETYNTENDGMEFYQGRADFGERFPTIRLFTTDPIRIAQPMDVLLSVRAPVGEINQTLRKCCVGRGLAAIRSDYKSYTFYRLLNEQGKLKLYEDTGTVFGSATKSVIENIEYIVPPKNVIRQFEEKVHILDQKIFNNHFQIQTLSQFRDTLLPKLMRGEVRVKGF